MATDIRTVDEGEQQLEVRELGLIERVRALDARQIMALGAVILVLFAFLAYVGNRLLEAPYTLLFGELAPADAREIIQKLESQGVSYRLEGAGTAILVPSNEALRLRMDMAADGLPGTASVGYELFDQTNPLTTTDFLSNVNLTRALEGELARTISSLRGVKSARVHLVQPKRRLFARDEDAASASIVLSLRTPGGLDRHAADAIRHIVAAAVPGLEVGRITIVDDRGELLARSDGLDAAAGGGDLDERRAAFEERLRGKIVGILERSIGPGRVHAEVSVQMDFDEVELQSESFDPQGQVPRSTQAVEETAQRTEAADAGAIGVENNLPVGGGDNAEPPPNNQETTARTEETTNFEISRTLRQQTRRGGRVERLSIAVQVDGIYETLEDGSVAYTERTQDELERIESLVRSAAGFDDERGDLIEVVSTRFVTIDTDAGDGSDGLGFTKEDIWRAVELLGLIIAAFLVLQFGLKPVLRRIFEDPQKKTLQVVGKDPATGLSITADGSLLSNDGTIVRLSAGEQAGGQAGEEGAEADAQGKGADQSEDAGEDEHEMISLSQISGQVRASLVNEVAQFVEANPEAAVRVIRNWLHGT